MRYICSWIGDKSEAVWFISKSFKKALRYCKETWVNKVHMVFDATYVGCNIARRWDQKAIYTVNTEMPAMFYESKQTKKLVEIVPGIRNMLVNS